jgi:hypothetical protein
MGLEIASVTQYVQSQLNKIPNALRSMVDNLPATGEGIADMGALAVTSFNAMIASGMTWGEALAALGPTLAMLKDKYTELGIAADPALQELMNIAKVREENIQLFNAIDANLQVMQALSNTGFLTAEALAAVEANARNYYQDLIDAGVSADDATRAMLPTLQAIYDAHIKSGEPIDENTQKLIDQAIKLGLIKPPAKDPGEEMAKGFDKMVEVLERIVELLGGDFGTALDKAARRAGDLEAAGEGVGDAWEEAARRAREADWGDGGEPPPADGGGGGDGTTPGYASGGVAWHPQLATIAEREPEVIIPMSDYKSGTGLAAGVGGGAGASGTVVNLTINAQTLDDNTIRKAAEKIKAALDFQNLRYGYARG